MVKKRIPSYPQIVEGTMLELYTLFSCKASKTQLDRNYALHIVPKQLNSTKKIITPHNQLVK